jgi:hypothetical protein
VDQPKSRLLPQPASYGWVARIAEIHWQTDRAGNYSGWIDFFLMEIGMNKCVVLSLVVLYAGRGIVQTEPYVHDTIRTPVMDLVKLDVPQALGNRELASLGLVDVTAAPFEADPQGGRDSTAALQAAINFARDHQMVCFLPHGTYRVSDTLSCIQGYYRRQNGKLLGATQFPCVLRGASEAGRPRPRIVLAPGSPGFGEVTTPKYVVHFWARSTDDPDKPQPNICFNQAFQGIDIEIGQGNPGAVAIRLRGAQGSGIEDCTIDATHGLTGVEGGCGSGGSHTNITVIGGQVGMDLRQTQPAPTITGITLVNQERTALLYGGRQALCAVGLKIAARGGGAAIRIDPEWDSYFQGPLVLVDSEIAFERSDGRNTVLAANRSFYMHNVYARRASRIVIMSGNEETSGNESGWVRIREYAQRIEPQPYRGMPYETGVYRDGQTSHEYSTIDAGDNPPDNLQSRHLWTNPFPNWQAPGTVNVKEPPYRAQGDGVTDDTQALQRAIDENTCLFLPKGIYRVTRTLRLKPETKIIGVANVFSVIAVRGDEGYFTDSVHPKPVVETADAADGQTVLAHVGIYVPYEVPGAYALNWMAGRNSICRDVGFLLQPAVGYGTRIPQHAPRGTSFVRISADGGGKWYNFELGKGLSNSGYRQILVDGTSQPLAFYHCCPEGARSEADMEIRNAKNVSIYGLKSEGNSYNLWLRHCDNVKLFGYGGNASGQPGSTLFRVEDCQNFLLAGLIDQPMPVGKEAIRGAVGTDPTKYHMVIETLPDGSTFETAPLDRPILYQRGTPNIPR